jgi:hypothetical protein
MFVEGQPVPGNFSAVLFAWLLGAKPTFADYERFDPDDAQQMRDILNSRDDVSSWALATVDGAGSELELANFNRREFVEARWRHHLVGSRQPQLDAVRRGFVGTLNLADESKRLLDGAINVMADLAPTELMIVLCGDTYIDAAMMNAALDFDGIPHPSRRNPLVALFGAWFAECDAHGRSQDMQRFIRFATGGVRLPHGRKIKVVLTPGGVFGSHPCFVQVDVPAAVGTAEDFRNMMTGAIAHIDV